MTFRKLNKQLKNTSAHPSVIFWSEFRNLNFSRIPCITTNKFDHLQELYENYKRSTNWLQVCSLPSWELLYTGGGWGQMICVLPNSFLTYNELLRRKIGEAWEIGKMRDQVLEVEDMELKEGGTRTMQ